MLLVPYNSGVVVLVVVKYLWCVCRCDNLLSVGGVLMCGFYYFVLLDVV